ncbi:MAG TPA: hypothetical protein VGK58_22685, partial [Lacipirellulaceae bacterium]
ALAGVDSPQANRGQAIPRALHYGVWEIPVSAAMPLPTRWWFSGKRFLFRQIRSAAQSGAVFQLVVDAPAMDQEARRGLAIFEWLLLRVAELRNRGMVCVETLAQAAARLSAVPTSTPQYSILRKAA